MAKKSSSRRKKKNFLLFFAVAFIALLGATLLIKNNGNNASQQVAGEFDIQPLAVKSIQLYKDSCPKLEFSSIYFTCTDGYESKFSEQCQSANDLAYQAEKECVTRTPISGTPTPTPTCFGGLCPSPSPSTCKTVYLSDYSTSVGCGNDSYRFVKYACSDGYTNQMGGLGSCKTGASWKQAAYDACLTRTACTTPTSTPTPALKPSIYPSRYPTTPTPTPRLVSCTGLGDMNQDGKINSTDYAIIIRAISDGGAKLTPEQQRRADINRDGKVNEADGKIIAQYLAGIIKAFPNCPPPTPTPTPTAQPVWRLF